MTLRRSRQNLLTEAKANPASASPGSTQRARARSTGFARKEPSKPQGQAVAAAPPPELAAAIAAIGRSP